MNDDGVTVAVPSISREIRQQMLGFRKKSPALGLSLFGFDAAAYLACFLATVVLRWPWEFKIPLSAVLGLLITRLFIVGHDAAHGSLTGYRVLDEIISRLAFLPSAHPCSLWKVGHNRVHHSFTNLKGIDFIWMPFSPAEYRELSPLRRRIERFYRSVAGMGAYYMFEIWWKYLSVKGLNVLGRGRAIYLCDVALALAFPFVQSVAVYIIVPGYRAQTVFIAVVLPFLIWNWLMGFIIYNHHTSVSVRFFNNRSQWRFYEGQIRGTVHLVFPRPISMALNRIMEHTAHHMDVKIPCYRLAAAQDFIEERLGEDLVVEHWSIRSFLSTLRHCQLYEYDQHRWVTFADAVKGPLND